MEDDGDGEAGDGGAGLVGKGEIHGQVTSANVNSMSYFLSYVCNFWGDINTLKF